MHGEDREDEQDRPKSHGASGSQKGRGPGRPPRHAPGARAPEVVALDRHSQADRARCARDARDRVRLPAVRVESDRGDRVNEEDDPGPAGPVLWWRSDRNGRRRRYLPNHTERICPGLEDILIAGADTRPLLGPAEEVAECEQGPEERRNASDHQARPCGPVPVSSDYSAYAGDQGGYPCSEGPGHPV